MKKKKGINDRPATRATIKRAAGFTLIELMITVAIIAILLAVATPSMLGYLRQRGVREATNQLAMDLQRAKMLAVARNTDCSIVIDAANNRYTISLTNQVMELGQYRGGVVFTGAPASNRITFRPWGICLENAFGNISLTNADGTAAFRVRTTMAGGISQQAI